MEVFIVDHHGRPEIAALWLGGSYTLDNLHGFFAAMEDTLPVHVEARADGSFGVVSRDGEGRGNKKQAQ